MGSFVAVLPYSLWKEYNRMCEEELKKMAAGFTATPETREEALRMQLVRQAIYWAGAMERGTLCMELSARAELLRIAREYKEYVYD